MKVDADKKFIKDFRAIQDNRIREKVGATKINAAKEKGVKIITESEYINLFFNNKI